MATILFELFPAQSHHLMAFKMAKLLKDAGYRVVFGSVPEMQEIVQRHGLEFQVVLPWVVLPLKQQLLMKKKGIPVPNNKERLDEVRKNLEIFNQQIGRINPDLVLLDRHLMVSNTLFYKNLGIQVAFVSPMPDPEEALNIPPFSSGFIPRDNWFSEKYVSCLWSANYVKRRLKIFWHQLAYPGINDLCVYRKLAKEFGIDPKAIKIPNDASGLHLQTTPLIVLSATDLDFSRSKVEGVYNVGPMIDLPEDEDKSSDSRYEAMKGIITKGNQPVIYCSLGMLVDFCTDQKIRLYRKIKKVAILAPNYFFIICTGVDLDNSNLLPLPPNLFIFKSLPQKDLLKHCTLMINHGGLNSMTECIFNEVPVLAYPPSHQADHSSNSARAVFHGLGLRGRIGRDSPKTILKKINKIRNNYKWYKGNIQRMKKKFEEKNQSTEIVNIIESLIQI